MVWLSCLPSAPALSFLFFRQLQMALPENTRTYLSLRLFIMRCLNIRAGRLW